MKIRSEKGVIGTDYVLAIIIFVIGSVAVMGLYLSIYMNMAKIKIDETIIGYITEVCEQIDLLNYEEVDTQSEINDMISQMDIPLQYSVVCDSIEKFDNTENSENIDIVQRINIRINYTVDNIERNYLISKLKVKE